jgi:spore maturation protein A
VDTVWLCLIALGCATALLTGQVDAMMMSVIDGADQAIQLVIGLAGIYCLWSGIEKLAAESGLVDALASLTRPVLSFLFPRLKGDKHPLGDNIGYGDFQYAWFEFYNTFGFESHEGDSESIEN